MEIGKQRGEASAIGVSPSLVVVPVGVHFTMTFVVREGIIKGGGGKES